MTRVSGTHIIAAPCCGREYATSAYSSINFGALEYWTDGAAVGSLAPQDGGLRRCACGRCFLIGEAERLFFIPKICEQDDLPSRFADDGVLNRLLSWVRKSGRGQRRPQTPDPAKSPLRFEDVQPSPESWPRPERVAETALEQVIEQSIDQPALNTMARLLWWRHLNHPYREVYRRVRDSGQDAYPPFEPTDAQIQNMRALLALLSRDAAQHRVQIAELHRELGEFDRAREALGPVDGQSPPIVRVIEECLRDGLRGPVRFRL